MRYTIKTICFLSQISFLFSPHNDDDKKKIFHLSLIIPRIQQNRTSANSDRKMHYFLEFFPTTTNNCKTLSKIWHNETDKRELKNVDCVARNDKHNRDDNSNNGKENDSEVRQTKDDDDVKIVERFSFLLKWLNKIHKRSSQIVFDTRLIEWTSLLY